MEIQTIGKAYSELYQAHREKEVELEGKIVRLEKRLEQRKEERSKVYHQFPSWIDYLIEPIAEELVKHFPDYRYEIFGPFGICSETSIHFYKNGIDKEYLWEGGHIKFITFIPLELSTGEIGIRDRTVDTHKFSKGTMGELNGMNHPTINIPSGADIDWLLKYVH